MPLKVRKLQTKKPLGVVVLTNGGVSFISKNGWDFTSEVVPRVEEPAALTLRQIRALARRVIRESGYTHKVVF